MLSIDEVVKTSETHTQNCEVLSEDVQSNNFDITSLVRLHGLVLQL
jgi:hypothetical protein